MTDTINNDSVDFLREKGKGLFFRSGGSKTDRDEGISLIHRAACRGDAEALYIIGTEMMRGTLRPRSGDRIECAYDYLVAAANSGSAQAKAFLNSVCLNRYGGNIHFEPSDPHPLTDFEGKRIRIERKGVFAPVDAGLSFDGEINTLTMSANVHFLFLGNEDFDRNLYTESILRGFRDWEGEYEVFCGQRIRVELKLTTENRIRDSIHVVPLVDETRETTIRLAQAIGKGKKTRQVENVISHRRSFAGIGIGRWSVHSTKLIYMQSRNGRFDDPDELRDVARHEFGHVLGLGDLYASESDGLEGVEAGQFNDLSCFHLFGRTYHLVMCDSSAPVSNNDIEMVILAFSRNRFQRFQKDSSGRQLSEALGKGN